MSASTIIAAWRSTIAAIDTSSGTLGPLSTTAAAAQVAILAFVDGALSPASVAATRAAPPDFKTAAAGLATEAVNGRIQRQEAPGDPRARDVLIADETDRQAGWARVSFIRDCAQPYQAKASTLATAIAAALAAFDATYTGGGGTTPQRAAAVTARASMTSALAPFALSSTGAPVGGAAWLTVPLESANILDLP